MKRLLISFILSFVFIQLMAQDPVTVKTQHDYCR